MVPRHPRQNWYMVAFIYIYLVLTHTVYPASPVIRFVYLPFKVDFQHSFFMIGFSKICLAVFFFSGLQSPVVVFVLAYFMETLISFSLSPVLEILPIKLACFSNLSYLILLLLESIWAKIFFLSSKFPYEILPFSLSFFNEITWTLVNLRILSVSIFKFH